MGNSGKMVEAIGQIADMYANKYINRAEMLIATVDAIDLSTRTCGVTTINDAQSISLYNVLLMASVDDGTLIVPSVGSQVVISYTKGMQPCVIMFSQIDKIYNVIGDCVFQHDKSGFHFESSSDSLATVLSDLLTELTTMQFVNGGGNATMLPTDVQKINNIKSRLATIIV